MATSARLRAIMKKRLYQGFQGSIPVVQHMRDLEGHLTSTARIVGVALTRRLEATMQTVARIATLPLDQEARARAINGKVVPMATYGSPAVPYAGKQMHCLRTAIAKVMDQGMARHRSPPAALALAATKT
eukprot:15475012-Alexandrium_andersonii.AAC.2